MLAMALIAMLAAPAATESTMAAPTPSAASMPRVPGTRLKLGMSEGQLLALGPFAEAKAPDPRTTARHAPGRFFGVPGEATCHLRDGVLAEVRFEASGVGAHSMDYVDGQLRMMGLARACRPDRSADRVCDWTGPGIRLHVEMSQGRLSARAFRWPPPVERPADSLRAAAKAPAGASRTRPASTAAPGAGAATGAAAAGATAGAAPGQTATAGRDGIPPAVAVVATLPETLTITPASRTSTTAWPRIVSSPPLQYPEKARKESLQGIVWVTALVDTSGKVMNASVERGIRELNDSALEWVRGSQFARCERNGAPCRFVARVAVLFTLY